MIRTIARRLSVGRFTLPALAAELKLSQDALAGRLFMMERLGFVERSGGCAERSRIETSSCRCCAGCSCSGGGTTRYILTEKGRRLAGRTEE